ncbi:MAG: LysE family translocator [Microbacteriaceae bacterium]|nr:LysE family translocator [Microbacteriaceae bacterium]
MDLALVGQFWMVAVLILLIPGADWAFAISAGMRSRSVAPSVSGMMLGYALLIGVIALGLGALVAANPIALSALTLAGAGYLLWIGVAALRTRTATAPLEDGLELDAPLDERALAQFWRGAGVSGLNPKAIVLLLAVLPQFTSRAADWPAQAQMLVLGGVYIATMAAVYAAVALLARRALRSRPRARRLVARLSGAALTLLGAALLAQSATGLL